MLRVAFCAALDAGWCTWHRRGIDKLRVAVKCGHDRWCGTGGIRSIDVAPGTDEELGGSEWPLCAVRIAGVLPSAFAESTLHLASMKLEKLRVAVLCGHECGCAVCGHPSIDDAPR